MEDSLYSEMVVAHWQGSASKYDETCQQQQGFNMIQPPKRRAFNQHGTMTASTIECGPPS